MKPTAKPLRHRLGTPVWILTLCLLAPILNGCQPSTAHPTASSSTASKDNSQPTLCPTADLLRVKLPDYLDSQTKEYEGFTVSFNLYNHTPNYVAWELLASETDGTYSRKGKRFRWDASVDGCPDHDDYTNSGYDRGHMIPAADCKYSAKAMDHCFFMTNICPQDRALNAGGWKKLEEACRQWALRNNAIIIVAGPIYRNTDSHFIGDSHVRVPSAFFKVVLDTHTNHPKAIGFIYPNSQAPGEIYSYAMSVRDVEKITRFNFFHQLPDSIEDAVETTYDLTQWTH